MASENYRHNPRHNPLDPNTLELAGNWPEPLEREVNRRRRFIYQRDLLRELVARDMKMQYKHSLLGFAWSLLNPLLHLLVFYFIFRVVLTINMQRFTSHVLIGLLVWNWFQNSLTQAATAITGNRELVRRPGFNMTILPVISVITNLINFLFSLPVLAVVLLLDKTTPNLSLAVLPGLIVLEFILILGLSYIVAGANVLFRDTQHLLSVLLRLCFFLTPIFYDASALPARWQRIYTLNPMVGLVQAFRAILMGNGPLQWPSLLLPLALALFFLALGYVIFVRVNYRFVEEL
jgi:lipopolysaccharide transport system permease protein